MKIRVAYGNVIRHARNEKGLTLKQTAAQAYMSYSYLHEVETGKKEASSEYLGAILCALEVPPVRFFREVANEYQRLADEYRDALAA